MTSIGNWTQAALATCYVVAQLFSAHLCTPESLQKAIRLHLISLYIVALLAIITSGGYLSPIYPVLLLLPVSVFSTVPIGWQLVSTGLVLFTYFVLFIMAEMGIGTSFVGVFGIFGPFLQFAIM